MIGIHRQHPLAGNRQHTPPSYLVVFIGGFGDVWSGILDRVHHQFEGWFKDRPFAKSYYHWDGGALGFLYDNCHRIARDILEFQKQFPGIPVVIIGHSYGGSAGMEVARKLYELNNRHDGLILLTIDAVSRRQPKKRAKGLLFWGNSYLSEGGGLFEFIPRLGGRWGTLDEADVNIPYSGFRRDSKGKYFDHRIPAPFIFETCEGHAKCLGDYVRENLEELLSSP